MADILVVDDETSMRELLYDVLAKKGHAVCTAGSGPQALEMLKSRRPQVIVLDSGLPGYSGLQTAREIRAFDDTVAIILLLSAGETAVAPEELKRLGIVESLGKDAGNDTLIKGLETTLTRWQQQRSAAVAAKPDVRVAGSLLIVDDDTQIQRLLKGFFESHGLRVIVAGSGEDGLKAIAQRPMAVLLDINMPGMDGLLALKKIKAAQPNLPVIMASGVGEDATVREALQAGAYDYVSKPFNLEYLETVVLTKVLLGIEG